MTEKELEILWVECGGKLLMDNGAGLVLEVPSISRGGFIKLAAQLGGAQEGSMTPETLYHALKATEHKYESQQDRAAAILKRLQEGK